MKLAKCLIPGVINISNEFIYNNYDFRSYNSLSFFLFNVYLSEFDFYIFALCYQFNFKYLMYNEYSKCLSEFRKNLFFINPIKLKKNKLFTFSYNSYSFNFLNLGFNFQLTRKIYYTRYLDFFLVGLVSSRIFCLKLKNRLISFLKGNLFLNLETCNLLSAFENNINFLGYKIIITANNKTSSIQENINFSNKRIFNRLLVKKINFSKMYLHRFYFELGEVYSKFIYSNNLRSINFYSKRLFVQLFQLEAIRTFQLNKIFMNKDRLESFNIFGNLKDSKTNNLSFFKNYSFDIYLGQIQRALKEKVFLQVFPIFNNLIFSNDLFLNLLFQNFVKDYFSLFQSSSFNMENIKRNLRSFFLLKSFKNNNLLFSELDILNINKVFSNFKYSFFNKFKISVQIPIREIYAKLKKLGFVDFYRNQPIANVNYILLEDFFIIKFFGSFCFSLLNWYILSDNISKINFLIELIKKSCFLTLSRKHNKSKNWSYEVYSYDLVFLKKVFNPQSYFPDKKFIFKLNNYFLFRYVPFTFDESFFLNL